MTIKLNISPSREDYLKTIFELGGDVNNISNKLICRELEISSASVSEMIAKLVEGNYVNHVPYKGVRLTSKGIKTAALLIRKHRLWEVFLVNKLNYKINDVNSEAEILEHVTNRELAIRLEKYLDFPLKCPHGGIIPDVNGDFPEQSNISLLSLKIGKMAVIDRITDRYDSLEFISDNFLSIGDKIKVIDINEHLDIIKVFDLNSNKNLKLKFKICERIFVKEV